MTFSVLVARADALEAAPSAHPLLEALLREGFAVEQACSEAQVRAWLESDGAPDLLLLDRHLPDGDGFALCRALREQARTRELPVLLTACEGGPEARIAALEAGADDFLPRPCSRRELLLRIRAVLRRARPAARADPRATTPAEPPAPRPPAPRSG